MTSSNGGSGGSRGKSSGRGVGRHGLLPRHPAARPGASPSARVSSGAFHSRGHSSDNNEAHAICRRLLTNHVREILKFYLHYGFLSESKCNIVVHNSVYLIITSDGNQLIPNESSMERYVSRNREKIKKLTKEYVEMAWKGQL